MELLTAEQIEAADDLRYEDVHCPEWGGWMRIRNMDGVERDSFGGDLERLKEKDPDRYCTGRTLMVFRCACKANFERLFTNPSQLVMLDKKSSTPLDRCFGAALRVNGMSKEQSDAIEKNYESIRPAPGGGD